MPSVPIHFELMGTRRLPVIDLHIKHGSARLRDWAVVDTGSAFTLVPEGLLRIHRFNVSSSKPFPKGIHGLGGVVPARYLEDAVLALIDRNNQIQPINLRRLFIVDAQMPVIFGREAMTEFNGRLSIDFVEREGELGLG